MISNTVTLGYGPNQRLITLGLAGYPVALSYYGERGVDLDALTGYIRDDYKIVDDESGHYTWTCVSKAPFAVTGVRVVPRYVEPGEVLEGLVDYYVPRPLAPYVRCAVKSALVWHLYEAFNALKEGDAGAFTEKCREAEWRANAILGTFIKPGYFGWFVLTGRAESSKYALRVDVFGPLGEG